MALPEYEALITDLLKRREEDKARAESAAQGEAQRRGLVGQTGTSDIEFALRGAKTQPIQRSYDTSIAGILGDQAARENQQRFTTSEREAGQNWQSGEGEKLRGWQTGEAEKERGWRTGERLGQQDWQSGESALDRTWRTGERLGGQDWQSGEAEKERGWRTEERLGDQTWRTGERIGGQDWQDRANLAQRTWQSGESAADRAWNTGERTGTQTWQEKQNELDRILARDSASAASRDWWKNPVGDVLGSVGSGVLGPIAGGLGNILKGTVGGIGKSLGGVAKSVGGGIKKIFCFVGNTPVEMADGSAKYIKDISLGDQTKGGRVESIRTSLTDDGTLYNYGGVLVTGSHAVNEGGKWIRVEDSKISIPIPGDAIVYSIVTTDHRIFVDDIEFADEHETDDYETLSIGESLNVLNMGVAA